MASNKSRKAKRASKSDAGLAKKWKERLRLATDNQKKIFEKAKENYQIYYAIMSDDEKGKNWRSNTFLPLLPGKARESKAKMSILEPRFRVIPADSYRVENEKLVYDKNAVAKALKFSKKLDREFVNHHTDGGLPPRAAVDFATTDAIVAGWGLALAPLTTYTKKYHIRNVMKDGDGEDTAYVDQTGEHKVNTLRRVRTDLIPLDIFKVFISPKAKSFFEPRWLLIEREDTYAGLEKANSTIGELVYNLPAALKEAKPTTDTSKNDYSAVRDAALGYSEDGSDYKDETIDMFTLYDCYDDETNEFLTFIVAKLPDSDTDWTLIRRMANPYDHGLTPIVPFYTKMRPHSPWGESYFEISKDVQHAYNANFNQFQDNGKLSGETMALVDKNSIIDGFHAQPGGTIEYDSLNGEKPEPWKFADPNPAVLSAEMEILERNAESGTTPQYASGQVNSNMDKTTGTKGGIEMLMEVANDKLSEMYRNLKGSLIRYGFIAMHNAQQYQNYIEVIEQPDLSKANRTGLLKGQVSADFIAPSELQESFDIDIDDESLLPLSRSERRQMFLDMLNVLIELQKASATQSEMFDTPEDMLRIGWEDVSKELGAQFGSLNAPAFILPSLDKKKLAKRKIADAKVEQEANNEAMKIAQEGNPEAEVNQDPNGINVQRQKRELSNFKDFPADVKNAVLDDMGYPESQIVAEQAGAQLAEAKATQLDTEVKQQMINAAQSGSVDPATLAKFIGK